MSIQITVLLFVTITLLAASPINANSTKADYETTNDAYYSGNATTPAGSTTVDSVTTKETNYSGNATTPASTTIDSEKNGTNYLNSTTLSTPTGNFSTINGTFVPKKNQTYTPSYYYTVTRHLSTINGTFVPNGNQTYTPSYYYTLTPHLSGKNETDYFNSTTLSTLTGDSSMINETIASKKNETLPSYYRIIIYYNSSTTLQTPTGNFSFAESATTAQPQSNSSVGNYKTDDDEYNEKKADMEKRVKSLLERRQFVEFMNNPYDNNNTSNDTKNTTKEANYSGNATTPGSTTIYSFAESATTAQPQSNSSVGRYQGGDYKTDDDEYNKKKAIMENRVNYWRRRQPPVIIIDDQSNNNNSLNDTKDKFKPEITLEHRIDFELQETTTATPDFSDNQMLNETVNLTQQQYPNKFQVLFDLWLLDSGNSDSMGTYDWNNFSMSEIPEIIDDDYTLIQKKQTILNTFNVLSKFIEKCVNTEQPGSESVLRFFNGSTTMQDLVMIANVKDFIQLDGKTDETNSITNSDKKEMGKHGQKVFRKTYTYTEEETIFSNP